VIMGDRESDSYEVFAEIRERALRSSHPKCARLLRQACLYRDPSRWRIERFHCGLKTGGSNIEHLQRETYDRLTRAIARDSIVAWRILWMTYQVRQDPDPPGSVVFHPEEEVALRLMDDRQRPRKVSYTANIDGPRSKPMDPDHRLTLREAMHTLANLGGFLAGRAMAIPASRPFGGDIGPCHCSPRHSGYAGRSGSSDLVGCS